MIDTLAISVPTRPRRKKERMYLSPYSLHFIVSIQLIYNLACLSLAQEVFSRTPPRLLSAPVSPLRKRAVAGGVKF